MGRTLLHVNDCCNGRGVGNFPRGSASLFMRVETSVFCCCVMRVSTVDVTVFAAPGFLEMYCLKCVWDYQRSSEGVRAISNSKRSLNGCFER